MSPVILHINYFKCPDPARRKEYDFCFDRNRESGFFSEIINYSGRMTYDDFFDQTHNHPEAIHVLANLDIYFNETIKQVQQIKPTEAYALTRWEEYDQKIIPFEEHHAGVKAMHSQDIWVIRGAAKNVLGNFHLGQRGCDNRIAYELSKHYEVYNYSDRIQCIHRHANDERNYTIPTVVSPPYYWCPIGELAKAPSQLRYRTRV